MGACAGKKKEERSASTEPKLNSSKKPKSKEKKDNKPQSNTSPPSTENSPTANGSTVPKTNDSGTSDVEKNGISANIQDMVEKQDRISDALSPNFPLRVVSVTDTELESELATLVYGHPENDYAENPLVATTIKSTEV